jgi:hypothetical protein
VRGLLGPRIDLDARDGQPADQLGPGQRGRGGQDRRQRGQGPFAQLVAEAELETPAPVLPRGNRAEQAGHPAHVGRGHQVQRAPHGPGAGDVPVRAGPVDVGRGQPGGAGPDGEPGGRCGLGLEPAQVRGDTGHSPAWVTRPVSRAAEQQGVAAGGP